MGEWVKKREEKKLLKKANKMSEPISREEHSQTILRMHERIDKQDEIVRRVESSVAEIKADVKISSDNYSNTVKLQQDFMKGQQDIITKLYDAVHGDNGVKEKYNEINTKISSLSTTDKIQWGLFSAIALSLIGRALWVLTQNNQ